MHFRHLFLWFSLKNDNWGWKMKILKFCRDSAKIWLICLCHWTSQHAKCSWIEVHDKKTQSALFMWSARNDPNGLTHVWIELGHNYRTFLGIPISVFQNFLEIFRILKYSRKNAWRNWVVSNRGWSFKFG